MGIKERRLSLINKKTLFFFCSSSVYALDKLDYWVEDCVGSRNYQVAGVLSPEETSLKFLEMNIFSSFP